VRQKNCLFFELFGIRSFLGINQIIKAFELPVSPLKSCVRILGKTYYLVDSEFFSIQKLTTAKQQ